MKKKKKMIEEGKKKKRQKTHYKSTRTFRECMLSRPRTLYINLCQYNNVTKHVNTLLIF